MLLPRDDLRQSASLYTPLVKRLALATLPLLLAAQAHAWDTTTHKIIGVIAYRHLTPKAKAWCDRVLATNQEGYRDFLNAAPYPDYLKHGGPKDKPKVRQVRRFDGWHYVDFPVKDGQTNPLPYDTSVEGNGDNVLYGIKESIQSMTTGLASTRGFYMAMLLHLVGDVHQPLHCAERDADKGGNGFEVDRGSIKSLHALWDDGMTVRFKLRSVAAHTDARVEAAASQIEADLPLAERTMAADAADIDPRHWAMESYMLAVDSAYEGIAAGERPSAAYEARWLAVSERRVALAGYRLAGLLNKLAATAK